MGPSNGEHTQPLLRWTNVSMGGVSDKVFFRYERLADFCYYYGHLDHMEKDCDFTHPEVMRYYDSWLRAYGKYPTSMKEIIQDLNRLNPVSPSSTLNRSPRTPGTGDSPVIKKFLSL